MSEDKECFIIMPITTPETMIGKYRDREDHFRHVLDCLFKPAIDKAGYIPIAPIAEGSDLIHAEIIKNLETADIILCDMSSLNPNVFFEFGIRTSLNKPVCIVKDELTISVPFDPGILNHHEYKSSLEPWELETEIKKLSDHLAKSSERSKGVNTLWKYFGFKSEAEPYKVAEGPDSKLDYLAMQMDSLQEKIDQITIPSKKPEYIWCSDRTEDLKELKGIKVGIEALIHSDNKSNRKNEKNVITLYSEFQRKVKNISGSSPPIPISDKHDIMAMDEYIHKLMKGYFPQKGSEEQRHGD